MGLERFKNMPTQAKNLINFKNAICPAVRITGEPCAGLQEGRWDLLHPASIPGELIPPQLCPGIVCTENRLILENTVLGREGLSHTIKSPPYLMEKGCPGGFGLAPAWLDALHATVWP